MKRLPIIVICLIAMSFSGWETNFEIAKQKAKERKQLILLNFSGSDWCGPCIRLRKEVFETEVFTKMADSNLVLINADFPRDKKNRLDKSAEKQNEALAEIYNKQGAFPLTLLLSSDGKILKTWDGLPKANAIEFTIQLRAIVDTNK